MDFIFRVVSHFASCVCDFGSCDFDRTTALFVTQWRKKSGFATKRERLAPGEKANATQRENCFLRDLSRAFATRCKIERWRIGGSSLRDSNASHQSRRLVSAQIRFVLRCIRGNNDDKTPPFASSTSFAEQQAKMHLRQLGVRQRQN